MTTITSFFREDTAFTNLDKFKNVKRSDKKEIKTIEKDNNALIFKFNSITDSYDDVESVYIRAIVRKELRALNKEIESNIEKINAIFDASHKAEKAVA